jgi:hypothetical protein
MLLVFLQMGCKPCERIVPILNRIHDQGRIRVLGIQSGSEDDVQAWSREVGVHFAVILQKDRDLSLRYQVFATPFAFLIDEHGRVVAKGLVTKAQHVSFVLGNAA